MITQSDSAFPEINSSSSKSGGDLSLPPNVCYSSYFLLISLRSSSNAVCHASGLVTGITLILVLSFSPSDSIQILSNPLPSADAFLRHRRSITLTTFSVQALMGIGQQGWLARELSHRRAQQPKTSVQNSTYVIRLTFPSNPSVKIFLSLSENFKAAASGVAGIVVPLSERTEAARGDVEVRVN